MSDRPASYSEAGVDRDQEEEAVETILSLIKSTYATSSIPEGHFAGSIPLGDYLLSLATDGVGSKVILAQELRDLTTIGIDCVAMNVNDLIAIGAVPAAFVDYIAIRKPDKEVIKDITQGLVEGCIEAEIPLIGGETATLPEVITPVHDNNGFDVAGTALGIHRKSITGEKISTGDKIIGIRSNGIHSNGLTLARRLINDETDKLELLRPTRIYVKAIKDLLDHVEPHGMAHITGGGLTNLLRLGKYHYYLNKLDMLTKPKIFATLQSVGNIGTKEMYRTFNMGVGFVVIVSDEDMITALKVLNNHYPAFVIGEVRAGDLVTVMVDDQVFEFRR